MDISSQVISMSKFFKNSYLLLVVVLLSTSANIWAIDIYPDSSQINRIYSSDSNAFYFNFDNKNFFWNNEYFGSIASGYTLIGYNLAPELEYHFSPNIKVKAGMHILKYSGIDIYSKVLPIYSIEYHKNRMSFVLGTIYGGTYHNLPDIAYSYERNFTHNPENGMQFRLDRKRILLDAWIDWQSFIFHGDDKQEKLLAGISLEPVIMEKDKFILSAPMYTVGFHKGGQINTVEDEITTILNHGGGLKGSWNIEGKYLTGVSIQSQVLACSSQMPKEEYSDTVSAMHLFYMQLKDDFRLEDNGYGVHTTFRLMYDKSFVSVSHWYADNYLSIAGNPLYHSLSEGAFYGNKHNRHMINGQLYYSKQLIKYIDIGIMGECFYDINTSLIDYSLGVKICIDASFELKGINKRIQSK